MIKKNKLTDEKTIWENTSKLLTKKSITLSPHWSYNFINDPKRLGFVLSRYKFAAKMACKKANVLELGCSEGIGCSILAENAISYTGIDLDKEAIDFAKTTFCSSKYKFIHSDFIGKKIGDFEAVISLDVIEHIYKENETAFFETICENLTNKGICIVGTPNIISGAYASEASRLGHVNLFSQERLVDLMKKYFYYVLPFGMNDEILHTGFSNMSHYLINIGCRKK